MARSAMQRNATTVKLFAISVGLAALLSAPSWATTTVDQIDVVSSRYGTELKLHADQPIQHRVIQASDTDMTIELSDVSPARHLRTNFSQAGQVHHVIVQPVGGNTLKVVLRGQSMGQPLVQVVYSQPPSTGSTPHALAQPLMPASQPIAAAKPITTPITSTPSGLPPVLSNPTKAPSINTPLGNPLGNTLAAPTPAKAAAAPATYTDVSEPLYLEDNATGNALQSNEPTNAPEAPAPSGLMGLLAQHWMYALIAGSMLLALVAGLGLFIYKKWQELQQPSRSGNVFRAMQQDDWQSAPLKITAKAMKTMSLSLAMAAMPKRETPGPSAPKWPYNSHPKPLAAVQHCPKQPPTPTQFSKPCRFLTRLSRKNLYPRHPAPTGCSTVRSSAATIGSGQPFKQRRQ